MAKETMQELLKRINKEAKEEILTEGLPEYAYKRIPFSSLRMNYCTYGGIPVGKITEFYGDFHSGKTTTALDIVANYQHGQDGRKVLYVDAENTLDSEWAKKLGVNLEETYIVQPKSQSAEEIFQIICDAIETDEIGLWVLDSIGVLVSKQEWEKDFDQVTYGGISKPLTSFSKKVEGLMARYHCTGVAINQIRDKIGTMFPMTDTPGGRAFKHVTSVRMEFRRGKFIDADGNELSSNAENPAGNIVLMEMTKNKTCKPDRRKGHYKLYYDTGIDYIGDIIDLGILYGIIDKRGAWYSILDVDSGEVLVEKIQGQSRLVEFLLDDDPDCVKVLKNVEDQIQKKMQEN